MCFVCVCVEPTKVSGTLTTTRQDLLRMEPICMHNMMIASSGGEIPMATDGDLHFRTQTTFPFSTISFRLRMEMFSYFHLFLFFFCVGLSWVPKIRLSSENSCPFIIIYKCFVLPPSMSFICFFFVECTSSGMIRSVSTISTAFAVQNCPKRNPFHDDLVCFFFFLVWLSVTINNVYETPERERGGSHKETLCQATTESFFAIFIFLFFM